MDAIWQSPTIFLHQRNKGVAEQFLLSFVFSCKTTTHANESEIDKNWLQVNKVGSFSAIDQHQVNNVGLQKNRRVLCKLGMLHNIKHRWIKSELLILYQHKNGAGMKRICSYRLLGIHDAATGHCFLDIGKVKFLIQGVFSIEHNSCFKMYCYSVYWAELIHSHSLSHSSQGSVESLLVWFMWEMF